MIIFFHYFNIHYAKYVTTLGMNVYGKKKPSQRVTRIDHTYTATSTYKLKENATSFIFTHIPYLVMAMNWNVYELFVVQLHAYFFTTCSQLTGGLLIRECGAVCLQHIIAL